MHHIDFGFAELIPQTQFPRLQKALSIAKRNSQINFKEALMSVLAAKALENPLSHESKAFVDNYVRSRLEKNQPVTDYLKAWDIVTKTALETKEHSRIPINLSQHHEQVVNPPRSIFQYALHV